MGKNRFGLADQMDDSHFISLANKEASKHLKKGRYPCFCFIVRHGKIIAQSYSKDTLEHAELLAMRNACKKLKSCDLRDCTLYTNIEPCLMCAKAIVYSGIKKVVYGTEHKEYGQRKSFDILRKNGIGKEVNVVAGIEKEEASRLLNVWMALNK